jgi:hypothetical protein
MIEVAKDKAGQKELKGSVEFQVLDIQNLESAKFERPFDLVFSNFGAVNCLGSAEIDALFQAMAPLLRTETESRAIGRVILVAMPSFCAWESLYFLLKFRCGLIFRRMKRDGVPAKLGSSEVRTWYYSPRQIRKQSRKYFQSVRTRPVGLFLPPSYLDTFFANKKWLLNTLAWLERIVSSCGVLSGASDHYIIELKSKK